MKYFLIVYDQANGQVLDLREYADHERQDALAESFRLENEMQSRNAIEVVVLGAQSEADLRTTHARYFKSISELAKGE